MLGKLIKHDFKSTAKVMIPVNLFLIATTLLGSVFLVTKIWDNKELLPLTIALFLVYILMITGASYLTQISLMVHYYRSMFSSQGYLTFTLPASTWSILNSKFIVGTFWALEIMLLSCLSMITLAASAVGFFDFFSFVSEFLSGKLVSLEEVSFTIQLIFGYTPLQLIFLTTLLVMASCFSNIAMGFGGVTIGQLFSKHKVAGAIFSYIGIYFFVQIITYIVSFFFSLRATFETLMVHSPGLGASETAPYQAIYGPLLPTMIVVFLIVGASCYLISGNIIKKRINLD